MTTATIYIISVSIGLLSCILIQRRLRPRGQTLADLPGPRPASWLTGNFQSFLQAENVGDTESKLIDEYGLAVKLKGTYNTDFLFLADPKGIQYVLNTCGYTFHRQDLTFIFRLITGPSLMAVEGEDHVRQRKILLPGFSHNRVKDFVPTFPSLRKVEKWHDMSQRQGNLTLEIDVYHWLSRLTLDASGQAAFSYDFGALNDTPSNFIESYRNLFLDMLHKPTTAQLTIGVIFRYMPLWVIPILYRLPGRGMKRLTNFRAAAKKVATEILTRERQALKGLRPEGRDIMNSLVRANMSEDPKSKMSNEELLSQMTGIILGGHDTTTAALVWVFYELSRHPDVQIKMREEIRATRAAAAGSGRADIEASDFDSMTYTNAIIKECLRFYPIAPANKRTAGRDELIPLSTPVKTLSGEEIHAIPIKEGQNVIMSIWAYNRIKGIWGDDADQWNPERFLGNRLGKQVKTNLGVYANLATFSSGVHSCIGWRFALFEIQAVLITLVEKFEFSPSPNNPVILQGSSPTLIPLVKGEEKQGASMPLTIRPIS